MPIIVNGERIEDEAIEAEVMRGRRAGTPPSGPPGFDADEALRRQARENLISRTLLQQRARKSDVALSDEEIRAGIEKLMNEHGGREAFYQQAGLSEADQPRLREHVELRQELLDGADLAEAANQQSDCQEEPDGDLGFFAKGKMVEAFETIVFSMNVGEISPVFMTQFGYHVATVTEKREARQQLFEEVREQVCDQLKDERDGEAIDRYMKKLRQQAAIKEAAEPAAKKPPKQKGKGKKGKRRGK